MNRRFPLKSSIILLLIAVTLTGCNFGARNLGGTQTINLKPDQKLENVSWRDSNLWLLTRSMKETDTAEVWTLQESSNIGILEGTVTITETKSK